MQMQFENAMELSMSETDDDTIKQIDTAIANWIIIEP